MSRSGPSTDPSPIRILLVDDHCIVRAAFASALGAEPDLAIVGEAAVGPAAIALEKQLRPDVVLLEAKRLGLDSIEATRRIRADSPATRVTWRLLAGVGVCGLLGAYLGSIFFVSVGS